MSGTLGYAISCLALALAGLAVCWPLLDGDGRAGTMTAAAVALPIQVGAFAILRRGWRRRGPFLAAWAGGMLARLAAVSGAAVLVSRSELPPAPTLLALAAFFLGMLLLEPLFLQRGPAGAEAR